MGKTVSDLKDGFKKCWGSLSLVFAFKQAKEQILFQVKPLKMLNKICFAHSRVTVKFSEAMRQGKRQHKS